MDDPLATRSGLLLRLRQPGDGEAWREFVGRYAPLVYRYARRHGLQDADAADVTQEVLHAVALALPSFHYDRRQGRFRSWLYKIARHHLSKFWRRAAKTVPARGTLEDQAGSAKPVLHDGDFDLWDEEYDNHLFRTAARQVRNEVRPNTWDAFWKTAVEGEDPGEVGEELGMSVGAVYVAKSRVTARLRQRIDELRREEFFENGPGPAFP